MKFFTSPMHFIHFKVFILSIQDDSVSQMRSLANQLKEMEEDRDRTEARLLQLQRCLVEAEEGNYASLKKN